MRTEPKRKNAYDRFLRRPTLIVKLVVSHEGQLDRSLVCVQNTLTQKRKSLKLKMIFCQKNKHWLSVVQFDFEIFITHSQWCYAQINNRLKVKSSKRMGVVTTLFRHRSTTFQVRQMVVFCIQASVMAAVVQLPITRVQVKLSLWKYEICCLYSERRLM